MKLIIGGAYRGKLDYALEKYKYGEKDVFFCPRIDSSIDLEIDDANLQDSGDPESMENFAENFSEFKSFPKDKDIVYKLHNFSWNAIKAGKNPTDELNAVLDKMSKEELGKKIFISDDISCGIVPMDKTERMWRESHGRMIIALAKRCSTVERVFCGIAMRLK